LRSSVRTNERMQIHIISLSLARSLARYLTLSLPRARTLSRCLSLSGQGHLLEGLNKEQTASLVAQVWRCSWRQGARNMLTLAARGTRHARCNAGGNTQAEELDAQLPGGLAQYVASARELLEQSRKGELLLLVVAAAAAAVAAAVAAFPGPLMHQFPRPRNAEHADLRRRGSVTTRACGPGACRREPAGRVCADGADGRKAHCGQPRVCRDGEAGHGRAPLLRLCPRRRRPWRASWLQRLLKPPILLFVTRSALGACMHAPAAWCDDGGFGRHAAVAHMFVCGRHQGGSAPLHCGA